jgi:hypothetical protein
MLLEADGRQAFTDLLGAAMQIGVGQLHFNVAGAAAIRTSVAQ